MALSFLDTDEEQAPYGDHPAQPAPVPAIYDPFDVLQFRDLFSAFDRQIEMLRIQAEAVEVIDQATDSDARAKAQDVARVRLTVEAERKRAKEPYLKVGQAIDSFANPIVSGAKSIEDLLAQKRKAFLVEQDRIRREAEEQARRAAEAARHKAEAEARERAQVALAKAQAEAAERDRLAAEAAALENRPAPPPEPVIAPPPEPVYIPPPAPVVMPPPAADLKREWVAEVTNLTELLRHEPLIESRAAELLKAVTPWLNAQVKAGVRSLPGCAIYQTETVKTRGRK